MENAMEKAKTAVEKTKVTTVWEYFENRRNEIEAVLPKHVTIDRMIGVIGNMIKANPDIRNATQASLIAAVIQTVQNGLEPGGLGHCYYVPFNNKKKDGAVAKEVQFIIGYKGIIELVNRAGKAVILSTECVFENDHFECAQGLNPVLIHVPAKGDRGALIGVYATAKNLVANEKLYVYLTKEEIDKVRRSSKGGASDYSPWAKWYEEMAKKTAVKRISKLLPLSIDVQKAIATDETTKTRIDKDMSMLPDETEYLPAPTQDYPTDEREGPREVPPGPSGELTEEEKAEILKAEQDMDRRRNAQDTAKEIKKTRKPD